ncbi:hypothetical protein [Noviherbaspirillum sp. Root189]|uniref:hypothetical protein n=1 Tax=Noviherbaspirillum sp. Root189 TaxID=1736487 RepID=UPI00070D82E3|nr:hypothetical protein [Noviherbaspirillum sp. Root189]KRB81855.1 hypothetical protein ASE07_24225 [Noviherbaspirillum sp. Root189]
MDKYRILERMMRDRDDAVDTDLYCIAALLAERLEEISSKLGPSELERFIEIGAAICRYGYREFGIGAPVDDLFPQSEIWGNLR